MATKGIPLPSNADAARSGIMPLADGDVITPAPGLNPYVNQIYPIVNDVYLQMTGQKDIQAVDTASLVAMGNVLENRGQLDLYLNTLNRRIGYTIDGYRVYESQYADMHRSQMEWGAIVQKLDAEMPDATENKIYDVGRMDGQSVDQWIISNPKVKQKLFEKEAPYSFFITMQRYLLKEAFLNEGAMSGFIRLIFGKVQNKIAFTMEELGRLCEANLILNLSNKQHYHLVSMYNSATGNTLAGGPQAMNDANFLRYAAGIINLMGVKMRDMSVLYNAEDFKRFTPPSLQRFHVISDFMSRIKTVVSYAAFNKDDVLVRPDMQVGYWQVNCPMNDPDYLKKIMQIKGTVVAENGSHVEKTLDNVVGLIYDYEAMGTFRQEQMVLTTPVNARAAYYNTFWHENQLWFNDLSENAIAFFLD